MHDEIDLTNDVRILRRRLAKGFISHDQLGDMLSDLPDVADHGEWFDPTQAEPEAEDKE